jgi:rubrerythrin
VSTAGRIQMATKQEIVNALNVDLSKEHGAIYQYMVHSAQLRDSVLAGKVMDMAREEMWHFDWLVEAIRDRGGEPTLERADVFLSSGLFESVRTDVATEKGALEHYEHTLALIGDDDPALSRLIERIMDDERHHMESFARMAEDIGREGEEAFAAAALIGPEEMGTVAPVLAIEYEGILQYLWNKYSCGSGEESEGYFELAIDEMRHGYWAGGYLGGMGEPRALGVPVESVTTVSSLGEARETALAYELKAQSLYATAPESATNPDLKSDLDRARFQHGYHRFLLDH